MGHFLEVAYKVLSDTGKALTPKEITDIATERQLIKTCGKTPQHSMRARLSTDILSKKDKSLFIRIKSGKFGLRSWTQETGEYIAPRFKKALLDEDILVLPKASLFNYIPGTGLHATLIRNRGDFINELFPMKRRLAELDFEVIQLVSAFIVRYFDKYLTYKRTKRLPEERLHGFYSIPFGGHLNPDDLLPLFDIFDPRVATDILTRELREEIKLPKNKMPIIKYKGLLYDDSREVSRQHLGIVYDVYFPTQEFTIGERGFLMDPKFETLEEIQNRKNDFENWSMMLIKFEQRQSKSGGSFGGKNESQ